MLEGSLPGGLIIKGLGEEDHLQSPHHIPLEMRACSMLGQPLLLAVHLHVRHHTPHRKTAFIPGSTTLLPTQMGHFRNSSPPPRRGRDCITQYRNPLLRRLNMSLTDTRGVHHLTPRRVACLSQVPWKKFAEEGFSGFRNSLYNSTLTTPVNT